MRARASFIMKHCLLKLCTSKKNCHGMLVKLTFAQQLIVVCAISLLHHPSSVFCHRFCTQTKDAYDPSSVFCHRFCTQTKDAHAKKSDTLFVLTGMGGRYAKEEDFLKHLGKPAWNATNTHPS